MHQLGRAAKRMTEQAGEEAATIHRLLEIGKLEEDIDIDYPIKPIDADVIIIDEMSMVDTYIMNYILKGIYLGTKLILIGDSNQLPSVGPGNVLKDIIKSERISTIELNEIFRQSAKSKIITSAHNVNNGITFTENLATLARGVPPQVTVGSQLQDFFYINEANPNKIQETIISLCTGRLKEYGDYEFLDNIQVLSPTKKGNLGTKELNKTLQEVLNPIGGYNYAERQHGDRVFRTGDRVMQIKNNYDILWKKENGYDNGTGIFNGELGIIRKIDDESKVIEILFDDNKRVWYEYSELDQIEHSYSITIHKSQGSEFDVVIICVPKTYPALLTRNLLYTGLTRAKELLIVIGNKQIIDFMVENVDNKKRNTGLKYKMEGTC